MVGCVPENTALIWSLCADNLQGHNMANMYDVTALSGWWGIMELQTEEIVAICFDYDKAEELVAKLNEN